MRAASWFLVAGLLGAGASAADEPPAPPVDPANLDTVTVTATRVARPAFEVPASVDVSTPRADTLGVNLSETLPASAGVVARDRQNYAQDTQISIRGFGARSTFGIRGLRVYLDDIPATQPDGQGQVSHFNLATAERVEVLRGPFSALYGNSSGGVISMTTADGTPRPEFDSGVAVGDDHAVRSNVGARGTFGLADYNVGYTYFHTDGYRDHSEAKRQSINGKMNLDFHASGRVTLLFNRFVSPDVQDPLGLTRAQYDDDPKQATSVAHDFNTRKSADQTQGGVVYEVDVAPGQTVRLLGYGGARGVEQYLSIPASAQASEKHSGGVVDLSTHYGGGDARWSYAAQLAGRPFTLVAGTSLDQQSQHRQGYENFVGDELGVKGRLRRDEDDDVDDFDQYLQASWDPAERWSVLAGVRHSRVHFDSKDDYIVGANGDDSGKRTYHATSPVAGVLFRADPRVHLYAALGRGFETPTFAELSYRSDGDSGLASLSAARSDNAEIGAKLRLAGTLSGQLALFHTNTDDELAVATNAGGRTTYRNVDTQRQGVEVSLDWRPLRLLAIDVAYTWLDAEFDQDFNACTTVPCLAGDTPVDKGTRMPGVPEGYLYAGVAWGGETGWTARVDGRYVDAVPVNDVNSASAPSYALADVSAGYGMRRANWRARLSLRVDNVFDKKYVGSVIVNDGNSRYYEPGPDRGFMAVLDLGWMP